MSAELCGYIRHAKIPFGRPDRCGVRRSWLWTLGLVLGILFSRAATAQGDPLDEFLTGMRTLSGTFEQAILDAEEQQVDSSAGQFWIERPGHLRWVYQEPYEQLLVVDGERAWTYDPDLEQVVVRDIDPGSAGPAVLLLFGKSNIDQQYQVERVSAIDGSRTRYRLTPRDTDREFVYLDISFLEGRLESLVMRDSLQQTTRIRFFDLRQNQPLAADLFQFTPPPDTDVIFQ